MSAQLKAAYDDLVTYLGKDAKGVEKAKRLKDAANELRKKLAAAEAKLEQMEAVKDAARERADAAEAEKQAAEQKRQQAEAAAARQYHQRQVFQKKEEQWIAINKMMYSQLKALTADMRPIAAEDIIPVFAKLRETVPVCVPPVCTVDMYGARICAFDRFSLAPGFTDHDLWQLGASIAMLASVHATLLLVSPKHGLMCKDTVEAKSRMTALTVNTGVWLSNIYSERETEAMLDNASLYHSSVAPPGAV